MLRQKDFYQDFVIVHHSVRTHTHTLKDRDIKIIKIMILYDKGLHDLKSKHMHTFTAVSSKKD